MKILIIPAVSLLAGCAAPCPGDGDARTALAVLVNVSVSTWQTQPAINNARRVLGWKPVE